MTATQDDLAELRSELRSLRDRAEITRLCDRYALHLDKSRHTDTWLDTVFTDDALLTFPMGQYKGMAGLTRFQEMARTTFERTHHISSNYDIELDTDRAQVRAHLMAAHVPSRDDTGRHFMIGGHYDAEAVRTPSGWRIRELTFDLVWTSGDPPKAEH
ncbi:MAG TPA: nuclear transport factor 2 family protein [Actinophytocola sp.]|uniref:nuclear transport factor 2 family protein n=1 Tax=Actinophytocola sp. TaxID=1872138 RepID=UPI002DBFBB79|nr:nuclear transport factor 2 family protein [Actinophytocola sp.]HEU5472953.1 nuclear transport factor 2 family protein [Actinophytocola sp.]